MSSLNAKYCASTTLSTLAGAITAYYGGNNAFLIGGTLGLLNGASICALDKACNKNSIRFKRIAGVAISLFTSYLFNRAIAPKLFGRMQTLSGTPFLMTLLFSVTAGLLPFLSSPSKERPKGEREIDTEESSSSSSSSKKTYDLGTADHWHKSPNRPGSVKDPEDRMKDNLNKAQKDHGTQSFSLPTTSNPPYTPLEFSKGICAIQGRQAPTKDLNLYVEDEKMILAAVFDGHGTKEAAVYVQANLAKLFQSHLSNDNDLIEVFKQTIWDLHQTLQEAENSGTTAVISYIKKETNEIYTATLGDSEATIYRPNKDSSEFTPLFLSPLRNWNTDRNYINERNHPLSSGAKPQIRWITRASRAIGYKTLPLSQKPKVTKTQMLSGDILILASDGLTGHVEQKKISNTITTYAYNSEVRLAEMLTNAVEGRSRYAKDNVTVIVIRAQEKQRE